MLKTNKDYMKALTEIVIKKNNSWLLVENVGNDIDSNTEHYDNLKIMEESGRNFLLINFQYVLSHRKWL